MKKLSVKALSLALSLLLLVQTGVVAANAAAAVGKVTSLQSYNIDDDEVNLKWKKVKNADGYQVYVYNSAKKKYEKHGNFSKNTATVKNLKAGTNYYFKVRAYFKLDSKYYYGAFSDTLKVKTSAAVQAKQPASAKTTASYIGSAKAGTIALNHAGLKKSQVREFECSFDNERGVQVYEVDFEYGRYDYEYDINAVTGKIIRWEKSAD